MMRIRKAKEKDLERLREIALQTGNSGKDATSLYYYKDLLGRFFCEAYVLYDKGICYVGVDENDSAQGYIVCVKDTSSFNSYFYNYTQSIKNNYDINKAKSEAERSLIKRLDVKLNDKPYYKEYPSHMHINLDEKARGNNLGKSLILKLKEENIKNIHLGVDSENEKAQGFYFHLGFKIISNESYGYVLGLSFT